MTSPVKMIIDTDPGVDDAIAIALAHAMPQIDLLGLTTAFGNTFVTQSSRNARYLLSMLGADAPVAQGAALPVGATQYEPSANVHGPEGFGDITDIPQIGNDSPLSAAEFLCEMARSHAGELVVCAVAPLTNIADALALDLSFAHNVKQLVIMGGAYETAGNITSFAEANIYHDPIAADRVFASEMNISMVGLNATLQTLMTPDDFADMAVSAPKIGGFINQISKFYLEFYRSFGITEGCPMHDAAAVLACTDPERFDWLPSGIRVNTSGADIGATLPDSARKPARIAVGVDAAWAQELIKSSIASLG